ncbi:uncharacterized protein CTRU02_208090 [Colletotrichum truncatum]|uniref:Uncharacterized protein n=1 Tax=Colletotrichum truncatum TaxID=5467 RepID=A0ACC3YVG1_COLTU|nr:uncharacterized protein CTRU02_10911 [Colletotrichum truncatum]KAF6786413.1 hypothetical protein CTRU02_10911 [Colletotrichum truncatum]
MAHLATRQRVLPALSQHARSLPFALRANAVSSRRFLTDKPGLAGTDIRDAADARKTSPPQPKISNASVPGQGEKLTKEQQREVDEHNRDFEEKHDRAQPASDDKVNKKFWSSGTEGSK